MTSHQTQNANSDLESMFDDEIMFVSGFEEAFADDYATKEELLKVVENANISSLVGQVKNLESSLSQRVADKINDSIPRMVADALEKRLHELLSDTLKTILPDLLKNYVKKALPKELVRMIDPVPASPKADTEGENASTEPQSDQVKDNESTAEAHKEQSSAQGEQSSNQAPPTLTDLIVHSSSEEPFAKKLNSESSDFSLTSPPKAYDKGKGIASEDDQLKQLMPFMEQSRSVLKILNHHQFNAAGKSPLSIEKAKAQMEEIKRLDGLKAKKEKSKKWLKKVTTPDELRAHAEQLAAYEAKKGKDEKKAGLKRKRKVELIHKVFVKEDIIVDGMHKKLVPPLGVIASEGLVIREPESGIFLYNASNEGLAECKASASNLRCIQVKDIVKEVEDYLKTYSSAGISDGM
ncbi:hypothetical protein Tco_0610196 [Tanacetum coccineum]